MFTFLRSCLFLILQIIITPFFTLAGLLLAPAPFKWRYYIVTRWSILMIWAVKWICGIDYHIKGIENLPNKPSVVLAKHQSAWETLFFQKLLPPQTWVIKKQLVFIPFFGWGLALLQPIAIDRQKKSAIKQLLEQGIKRLKDKRWVIIFPEGTRVNVGETGNYARSGAELALRAGVPIVPITHNAGRFWPKNGFVKTPGTITLVIGPCIYPSENDTAASLTQQVKTWIEENTPG